MYTTRALEPENPAELTRLLRMNNAAVPAVNELTGDQLRELIETATAAIAVVATDSPAEALGFILAFAPGAAYESENYRWFEARGTDFLYVDRIIVAEGARNRGLGPLLYDAVYTAARAAHAQEITCEVNVEPPNPGSLAFHERLGFERVGTLSTKADTVVVALLAANLSTGLGGAA